MMGDSDGDIESNNDQDVEDACIGDVAVDDDDEGKWIMVMMMKMMKKKKIRNWW